MFAIHCSGSAKPDTDSGTIDPCTELGICNTADVGPSNNCSGVATESECNAQSDSCFWCGGSGLCLEASNASLCNSSCSSVSLTECASVEGCKYCEKTDTCVDSANTSCSCASFTDETACNATTNNCGWCSVTNSCLRSDLPCLPARIIFATSFASNGNLGGIAGADNDCQNAATGANLSGHFRALLSTSDDFVGNRKDFFRSYLPYVRTGDGARVADNWEHLATVGLNGLELTNAPDRDQNGNQIFNGQVQIAWTGTYWISGVNFTEAALLDDCEKWTSSQAPSDSYLHKGVAGNVRTTTREYAAVHQTLTPCNTTARLYCVQQLD
ncbi:MAG: hypothetical protein IPJ88_09725 [Myxococcales bacterium]|nr:MAG: hypothetical protein IPJ88_09725 [Myxococcales bacterium]